MNNTGWRDDASQWRLRCT